MRDRHYQIDALYRKILKELSEEPESWKAFLDCAGYNFKLRFDEQVLLYAQRPDATAVLTIEQWNKGFHRWVNRGAKGIAVFDEAPDTTTLIFPIRMKEKMQEKFRFGAIRKHTKRKSLKA